MENKLYIIWIDSLTSTIRREQFVVYTSIFLLLKVYVSEEPNMVTYTKKNIFHQTLKYSKYCNNDINNYFRSLILTK